MQQTVDETVNRQDSTSRFRHVTQSYSAILMENKIHNSIFCLTYEISSKYKLKKKGNGTNETLFFSR